VSSTLGYAYISFEKEKNMMRFTICTFFCLITLIILSSQQSYAQSESSSRSSQVNQGQMLKELLDEVRQLRIDLGRMSGNAYRAQMVIERLRLQQEQVNRLTLELNKVNSEINDLRSTRPGLNEKIEELEKKVKTGLISGSEVRAAKAAMERLSQREQSLMEREPQLTAELSAERGNLEVLKARLDEIEREILTIGKSEEGKPGKRDE
jgi:DNA repair exonuclease SbcCD ATPase subunit